MYRLYRSPLWKCVVTSSGSNDRDNYLLVALWAKKKTVATKEKKRSQEVTSLVFLFFFVCVKPQMVYLVGVCSVSFKLSTTHRTLVSEGFVICFFFFFRVIRGIYLKMNCGLIKTLVFGICRRCTEVGRKIWSYIF